MKRRIDRNLLLEGLGRLGVWLTVLGILSFVWTGAIEVSWMRKLTLIVVGIALIVLGALRNATPGRK